MQEHPWVASEGFLFFFFFFFFLSAGCFGLDACCLFPPCVQAIIPLLVGMQLYRLWVLPGIRGNRQCLQEAPGCQVLGSGKDPWGGGAQAAPGFRAFVSGSNSQAGVGNTQSIWWWQQPGMCIPRRMRAAVVVLDCSVLLCADP